MVSTKKTATSNGVHPSSETQELLQNVHDLQAADVPEHVWQRAEDLFLDWLASAMASGQTHPIPAFTKMMTHMGAHDGPSQLLPSSSSSPRAKVTSAYWAAWLNGAASHTLEQDDLHNSSVMHPATVIFPAALAAAQDLGLSGRDMLLASIAAYEAGIRLAESLGRSHYRTFHTTSTVGTLAASLAVAKLLQLDMDGLTAALGSSGTQASGLWEFMRSGAGESKQLHCAHAASQGLLSAYLARDGVHGASDIVQGAQGLMVGMAKDDTDASKLAVPFGHPRWALLETSFKWHACCRHTHPAADALLDALTHIEDRGKIQRVTARVHQAALDVLGPVDALQEGPQSIHAAKFSMKSTLALIACKGSASLADFEQDALTNRDVLAFRPKVSMTLDKDVDGAYPMRWLGRVDVELEDGTVIHGICDEPKGDPGNTLTRQELEEKFNRLVVVHAGRKDIDAQSIIRWCWSLRDQKNVKVPLP